MSRLSIRQRIEVQALVASFNFSGFRVKINTNLCHHFRSFVGRDFKALAQCALFVFRDYFSPEEKRVWLALSKVYKIRVLLLFLQLHFHCNTETCTDRSLR